MVGGQSPKTRQLTVVLTTPSSTHNTNSFSEPHVTPGTVKIIRGEGMPLQKKPGEKGNLKVRTQC